MNPFRRFPLLRYLLEIDPIARPSRGPRWQWRRTRRLARGFPPPVGHLAGELHERVRRVLPGALQLETFFPGQRYLHFLHATLVQRRVHHELVEQRRVYRCRGARPLDRYRSKRAISFNQWSG